MSAFWGCEVIYFVDQYSAAVALPCERNQLQNVEVPGVAGSKAVQLFYSEVTALREKYGNCKAAINFGGPINNAVSVFGDEIYVACKIYPDNYNSRSWTRSF